MSTPLRLAFAGTPEFALPALEMLLETEHEIALVLTQPDRPAGRGRRLTPSPVKSMALDHGLEVATPTSLRQPEQVALIGDFQLDLMIVVAYGLLLPQSILDLPRFGCWNIHASLLPRWRGAAPIHRAIQAGDSETGVCIMQMDAGLDTGDVLDCSSLHIPARATTGDLHDRLARLGADTLKPLVEDLAASGKPPGARPQPDTGVTYADKLAKAEAELDWSQPADRLDRLIRAFDPWPVAWSRLDGERWRIWSAEPAGPAAGQPGQILIGPDHEVKVICGDGQALRLLRIQKPGGTASTAEDLARGNRIASGQRFEVGPA